MKHLYLLLITFTLALCSCNTGNKNSNDRTRKFVQSDGTVFQIMSDEDMFEPVSWYEIEKDGERHEFIWVGAREGGLTHWPSCKYCNSKTN